MKIYNSLKDTNDKILILLLCFMFLDWNNYGYYVVYLPLVYLIVKGYFFNMIDNNFILLVCFGLTYSLIDYLNTGQIRYTYTILPVINFPLIYLFGKYIGERNHEKELLKILWIIALSLASVTLISLYISFVNEGFSVVGRGIVLIGHEQGAEELLFAATGLYAKLLPLTLFIVLFFVKKENKNTVLFILVGILAFVGCLRLQSRSSIYITATALLLSLFLDNSNRIRNKIVGMVILISAVLFVFVNYSDQLLVIDRFQSYDAFGNGENESRYDLTKEVWGMLANNPFGGLKAERFAHNLWLDIARVSGWIPFIFMILLTWRWIKTSYCVYKYADISMNLKIMIVVITSCLTVYFNAEPILEGAHMLFAFFCLYFGMITSLQTLYKKS